MSWKININCSNNKSAVFNLDVGGIQEVITLGLHNEFFHNARTYYSHLKMLVMLALIGNSTLLFARINIREFTNRTKLLHSIGIPLITRP